VREECRPRVFENRVLRKIFGSKREEVTGECRRLRNTEIYDLYASSNVIRVIKSRRMLWTGRVGSITLGEVHNSILARKPEPKNHLEDLGVNGRITLK